MTNQSSNRGPIRTRSTSRTTSTAGQATFQSSSQGDGQKSTGASTLTSQVQDALDQQVVKGAKMMSNVANSTRRAADELQTDAPQLAGLVRGMADRLQDYSRDLENQSAADMYRAASDFTRQQPAVVFGLAALAGFLALRTFRSSSSEYRTPKSARMNTTGGESHGL
jgi:ElaB/YqjD/DUF883 family membrane-anchored ribosome-binding protein